MIAVDLTVTEDRSQVVDFSITLYKAKKTLIALANKNREKIQAILVHHANKNLQKYSNVQISDSYAGLHVHPIMQALID